MTNMATYMVHVVASISEQAVHHDDSSFHIVVLQSLAIAVERLVIDESEAIVVSRRVIYAEIGNLRAILGRKSAADSISLELLCPRHG